MKVKLPDVRLLLGYITVSVSHACVGWNNPEMPTTFAAKQGCYDQVGLRVTVSAAAFHSTHNTFGRIRVAWITSGTASPEQLAAPDAASPAA